MTTALPLPRDVATLADRLDHLAMCLWQEGRDGDAALVREAIEALDADAAHLIDPRPLAAT